MVALIYFVNHTKKEYVSVGEAEHNDITFVFTIYKWSIHDEIVMVAYIKEFPEYTSLYKNLDENGYEEDIEEDFGSRQ